ncbi:hypothetical protein BG000_006364 [Podila horticola]|nr:hypothetical protein BG000_006364 [Podila horticola]
MTEAESRSIQLQICQRIGSLKQLEVLDLGLDALASLKELRELRVDQVDQTMGAREVEWMVREDVWPKLERIHTIDDWRISYSQQQAIRNLVGKIAYNTYSRIKRWMGLATVNDSPAEWLRRKRPSLSVNFGKRFAGQPLPYRRWQNTPQPRRVAL